MTSLKLTSEIKKEPLVLGLSSKDGKLTIHTSLPTSGKKVLFSPAQLRQVISTLQTLGATGKSDEVTKVPFASPKLLVFTGLGKTQSTFDHEVLRRAAGAASRHLEGNSTATFALPHTDSAELAAIAEGAGLGAYGFHQFRTTSKAAQTLPLTTINIFSPLAAATSGKEAVKRANILVREIHLVRDLINTPPSHLTPASFSLIMKKEASALGLKVEILNEKVLKAKGFGGITAVGQGSANPPRLLRVSYSPAKAKRRLAFVGKGLTFDSGGLALKPANGMEAMKSDMSGAAAVIAAVMAIARLKLPIAVDGWAAMAENMVSNNSTRPSDIISIYGGKTVEVINPDAEGRLVLADALVRAQEFGEAAGGLDYIIDVATLTGAQGVALGERVSALMSNNEQFQRELMAVTVAAGELFWPMPLPEELRPSLESPVADIANMGERMGGMLVAGLFLRDFVDPALPWAHLDIASPALNKHAPHGYTPVGGTGVAVRSLVAFAELTASQG